MILSTVTYKYTFGQDDVGFQLGFHISYDVLHILDLS